MNPGLLLLPLLSLAGLLAGSRGRRSAPAGRRRSRAAELGRAWAVCGLCATALLAPALWIRDGVPSPAASLAQDAPWQGIADPAAGNSNLRDITYQVEPWLIFLRHELQAGRLPFWDPHQAAGCPFWSNGSGAPLFPLHLLFALLPLQLGLLLLPWLRLVIGGTGSYALARELGLSEPAALLAAVVYPLSGTVTSFVLFPMANVQALIPWVFLAVERLAAGAARRWWGDAAPSESRAAAGPLDARTRGRSTFGPVAALAALGGLQLLGGHPETAAYTALLSGVYLLVRGSTRPLQAWAGLAVGWLVAGLLAAVQLLPLALVLPETSRWLAWTPGVPPAPGVVAALLMRLVFPDLFGNPAAGTWWGPYNFAATSIYTGAGALALGLAGAGAARRDRRWLGVAAVALFALCAAYQLPGARHLMLALPVVRRGLHHYIKIGLELGLALLAGAGLEAWLEGRRRGILAGAALLLVLLGAGWIWFGGDWRARGLAAGEARWTAWAAATALVLALGLRLSAERRRRLLAPLLVVMSAGDLIAAHAATNPGLRLAALYPETGAVRFLRGRPERVAGTGGALHPNAAMVYGLFDVRGDDSIKLDRYERLYAAHLGGGHPTFFLPMDRWQDPWLDRLGVRWVVTGPSEPAPLAPTSAWSLAYRGPDARVYERPGALPLVRWQRPGPGSAVRVLRREPGAWDLAWRSPVAGVLVVAEVWDRGWSAEVARSAGPGSPAPPAGAAGSPGPAAAMGSGTAGEVASFAGAPGAARSGGEAGTAGTVVSGSTWRSQVTVFPAEGPLLGAHLGPGSGTLRLRYVAPGFGWGCLLSLLGVAVLAALLLVGWRARADGAGEGDKALSPAP